MERIGLWKGKEVDKNMSKAELLEIITWFSDVVAQDAKKKCVTCEVKHNLYGHPKD